MTFDILGISGKHKGSDGDGSEGTEILEIRLAPAGADALSDDGSIQVSGYALQIQGVYSHSC